MLNLEEIKAREQAATPGEWEWKAAVDEQSVAIVSPNEVVMCGDIGHFQIDHKDADFIAHSRTDIPTLIEQHEQDEKQIATLKKALELAVKSRNRRGCQTNKPNCNVKSCDQCWINYFIQQAQEGQK